MFSVRSESAPVPIPSDETVLIVGGRITSNYLEVAMLTLVVYNSCTYEAISLISR